MPQGFECSADPVFAWAIKDSHITSSNIMNQTQYLDAATAALKDTLWFRSQELQMETQVVRWGNFGIPLLLYPTAGGDAEEVERFFLIKLLAPFIHDGRLKVYSVESINGRTWITHPSVAHRVWVQQQYDKFIANEVVPIIRHDCQSPDIQVMTAGASIGAFNALLSICRHPSLFSRAICLSGTYDIQKWLEGQWFEEFYHQSPLQFLSGLPEDSEQLALLRRRFVLLATGKGEAEDPDESWKVADKLGQKGIPNRVDLWDESWRHDWTTWREMLPKYVQEMLASLENPS